MERGWELGDGLEKTGIINRGLTRIVEWIMEMGGCLPGDGAIYYMKAV